MEESQVLIFSSEQADGLALALEERLTGFCGVRRWKEEKELNKNTEALQLLDGTTKRYDFAIFLLTKADGKPKMGGGESEQELARRSLLCEYGILVGSLGRDRCFLAADGSVLQSPFPYIFSGVDPLKFKEVDEFTPEKSREAIESIIATVKSNLQKLGPRTKRTITSELISIDQIFEREKPESDGGRLLTTSGNVVLASLQPGEMVYDRAQRVRDNMRIGIDYAYFFPGDPNSARMLAQLLQMLLLCKRVKLEDAQTRESRFDAVMNQQNNIVEDLRKICLQNSLRIFFLPRAPALQFCIHNANDVEHAVAYLKYNQEFYLQLVLGEKHRNDNRIWKDLQLYIPKTAGRRGVFYSTLFFNIDEDSEFSTALKYEIGQCFPEISGKIEALCFKGP